MIAPHILLLSVFLSLVWGWHLVDEINDYREYRSRPNRIKGRVADKFRGVICAVCLLSICMAYVIRTALVLAGSGESLAGQLAFFTIIGVNVPGGLFVVVSRKFD